MNRIRFAGPSLIGLLIGAAFPSEAPDSASILIRGGAFDTERSAPAFSEEHRERLLRGRHVSTHSLFISPSGQTMAERTLDFSLSPLRPDYIFKDLRNGYEEGAQAREGAIRVFFRDSAQAPLREKRLKVPEPCVVNGGMGFFIRRNWTELAAGRKITFNMVVPARLDFYRFKAYVDPQRTLPEKEAGGRKHLAIAIEAQNSLLRMLIPVIVLYYDVGTKRMIRYQGISNVADAKGRSLRVRIDYPGLGP